MAVKRLGHDHKSSFKLGTFNPPIMFYADIVFTGAMQACSLTTHRGPQMKPMTKSMMKSTAKKLSAALAATAMLAALPFSGPAFAKLACDTALAAGKPAPPAGHSANPKHFRIFWHIATQIEDIADAPGNDAAMRDLATAEALADGFYVNALLGGPLIYWPERPKVCELNFKRVNTNDKIALPDEDVDFPDGGEGGRADCNKLLEDYLAKQPDATDTPQEIQLAALQRVVDVLKLKAVQAAGKPVWGANIIRNTDFSYDKATDKVTLNSLPTTYCVMNSLGITLNEMMLYQEPVGQVRKGLFVWIPRKRPNGELKFSSNARRDKIPENPRALGLIEQSFRDAGLPESGMRVNVRRTRAAQAEKMFPELDKIRNFAGYNFEGGTVLIEAKKQNFDLMIDNVAWILKNSSRDISMLMPGYWSRDEIDTEEKLDVLISRMRQLILSLNTKLNAKLQLPEGQNAMCTDRIVVIPASYGKPLRVKTLPMHRADGSLAATVTGQIKLLDEIRKELCGS